MNRAVHSKFAEETQSLCMMNRFNYTFIHIYTVNGELSLKLMLSHLDMFEAALQFTNPVKSHLFI